ncbi:hypothetical protein [Enterococcus sp. LJL51]|uniref:hypothetical protein n=1 Tax=Enterococcus sp. LJL51 TaxID=3416656 RepID=UPI003CF63996
MDINIWEILGIEATQDKKRIKKAYAEKLKTLKIDQEIDAFQQLKAAFDQALAYASSSKADTADSIQTAAEPNSKLNDLEEESESNNLSTTDWGELKIFSLELEKIKQTHAYYDDLALWEELTDPMFDWSKEEYWENVYLLQQFLAENYMWLSKKVLSYLFDIFDLDSLINGDGPTGVLAPDFHHVIMPIHFAPDFSFAIWRAIPADYREQYFYWRFQAYLMLMRGSVYSSDFQTLTAKCLDLTKEDSDIYNLLLLELLQHRDGILVEEQAEQFADLLAQAEKFHSNQTTAFLRNYYETVILKNKDAATRHYRWKKEELIFSGNMYSLLYGLILYHQNQQTEAFIEWQKLPDNKQAELLTTYKINKKLLPTEKQTELKLILQNDKQARKQTAAANKSSSGNIWWWLSISVLVIRVIMSISRANSTAPKTPIVNPIVTDMPYSQTLAQTAHQLNQKEEQLRLAKRFISHFYSTLTVDQVLSAADELFIREDLKEKFASLAGQRELDYSDTDIRYFSRLDGYEMKRYITIYYKDERLHLLKIDELEKCIEAVYSTGWDDLSEAELTKLINFSETDTQEVTTRFIKDYLFTENQTGNLGDLAVFLTPEFRKSLNIDEQGNFQTKMNSQQLENFRNGWFYSVQLNYNEIEYVLTNDQEDMVYFAFDEEGRLNHIYGDNWEYLETPSLMSTSERLFVADILHPKN